MSSVRVEVSSDLSGLSRRVGDGRIRKAQLALAEKVGSTSNLYAPVDQGTLRGSMHVSQDSVTWPVPYAKRVYYIDDARIRRQKNPNAHSHWFEHAKSEHLDDWKRAVEDELND